jgi:rod shape-determining protein MreC
MEFRHKPFINRNEGKKSFFSDVSRFKNLRWGTVLLIAASLFLLNLTPLSGGIKDFFYSLSAPLQEYLWAKGSVFSGFFETFSRTEEIKKENESLRKENEILLGEKMALGACKEENVSLRQALGLGLQEDFSLISANPIAKDVFADFIVLNKGSADGMVFDAPVVTEEKVLVGKVIEVYEHSSRVQLLTAKGNSFDVEIMDRDTYGLAEGQGNFKLMLKLVPRDREIGGGDRVFTSLLGGNFPQGLLVGEVKGVKKADVTSFQEADIIPAFDINSLEHLFIITDFR